MSAYAMYAPSLYLDEGEGLWIGGQFWDGRATGDVLGDPLADQALGPFLNPVEMANTSKAQVIADVAASDYADLFEQVWGSGSLDDVEAAYDQVALSIAAFERSQLFGQFSSKYDFYLQACLAAGGDMNDCAIGKGKTAEKAGKKIFSKEEWYGMQLFMGENNNDGILDKGEGAMCSACHVADWTPDPGNVVVPSWSPDGLVPPMFTDFTFDNLGVPKNTEYPLPAISPPDLGLGPIVGDPDENGKFKVMTLRNIGLTAPYAHNGLFKSLKEITHLYNTRDVPGALKGGEDWPPPEYPATVNADELGNLGLSDDDEDALVEFMKTLSDGWTP
jgi:cytochrome c peroxidase